MRRSILLVLVAVLGVALLPTSGARAAAVDVVVAVGRGRGHGVGMAQDGAFAMGAEGATMDQILDTFYPGAGRASATGTARVVVAVTDAGVVDLRFPDGGELRSPRSGPQRRGFPVRITAGGSAVVRADGSGYVIETGSTPAATGTKAQLLPAPSTSTTSSTTTSPTTASTTTTMTTFPFPIPPPTAPSTTTTATTAPPRPASPPTTTATTAPPRGGPGRVVRASTPEPVWAGPVSDGATIEVVSRALRYRGELEIGGSPLRVVNELDVEQYLWGLGEVSAAWSPGALRAQVVAARTYALRALAANGEICDTQRCQVYKGASGEFPAQVAAVNDTLGTVLTWNGAYASTVYSANAAGFTATPEEGFGSAAASYPYLPAVPYRSPAEVTYEVPIALTDLATRLGYSGTATSVRVATTGPSGRALTVAVDGSSGVLTVPAIQVQRAMGLQSTQWALRLDSADVAPAAPDALDAVQAAPDDVAAAVAEETTRMRVRPQASDRTTSTVAPRSSSSDDDGDGVSPLAWPLLAAIVAAGVVGLATLRRSS